MRLTDATSLETKVDKEALVESLEYLLEMAEKDLLDDYEINRIAEVLDEIAEEAEIEEELTESEEAEIEELYEKMSKVQKAKLWQIARKKCRKSDKNGAKKDAGFRCHIDGKWHKVDKKLSRKMSKVAKRRRKVKRRHSYVG